MRRFAATRKAIVPDQLEQVRDLDELTLDDPVERRDTVISFLDAGAGAVTLVFEGKELWLPPSAAEAVAAIDAATAPLTAAELPGDLDAASRLVLVRRLVREGFLRRAHQGE
jgi:hypothetical protein